MIHTGVPSWVVWFVSLTIGPTTALLIVFLVWEKIRPRPAKRVVRGDTTIELWVRERKYPSSAEAIVVPVAPDLKMTTGIAKWVRDRTANRLQRQAELAAPLEPGEVFVGSGGKFKFRLAALAVVMDDAKRAQPEWITQSVKRAFLMAREHDARSIIVPDMTEDLLRQPTDITDEQRRETCRPIAHAIVEAILEAPDDMEEIKIWCWRKVNEDIYVQELERLEPYRPVSRAAATAH